MIPPSGGKSAYVSLGTWIVVLKIFRSSFDCGQKFFSRYYWNLDILDIFSDRQVRNEHEARSLQREGRGRVGVEGAQKHANNILGKGISVIKENRQRGWSKHRFPELQPSRAKHSLYPSRWRFDVA